MNNAIGSLRYTANGRKRKTKALSNTNIRKKLEGLESCNSIPSYDAPPGRRTTDHIKSLNTHSGTTSAAPKREYTGDLVKGIGTMHKSNAIPIIDDQAMKDLANMRR